MVTILNCNSTFKIQHSKLVLALPLLKAGILLVDNIELSLPSHNLAIRTTLLNGCTNFHDELFVFSIESWNSPGAHFMILLFVSEYNSSSCQVIWAHLHSHFISRQNPYIVHPHFPRDGGQYFMPVFQLNLEHSIG